jgi:glycosyltransferase involved in cell wall biosynthesis
MKVLHVPYVFYPDQVGGTEIYVELLAHALADLGVDSTIAAPADRNASYTHAGLAVRRFALSATTADLRAQYGGGDVAAAQEFGAILDREQPRIVHLHAFTGLLSGVVTREVKRRGLPLVCTYHTPAVSCQRETLLRWGSEVCDGVLRVGTCAACTLHGLGVGRQASQGLGVLPPAVGRLAGLVGVRGKAGTALRMTDLTKLRHDVIRSVWGEADHIVAVCNWASALLQRNGVPASKISVSHHGLATQRASDVERVAPPDDGPTRIAFLGRLDPAKGPALLIEAVRSLPSATIQLDLYCAIQGPSDARQRDRLTLLAHNDPRIRLLDAVAHDQVVSLLRTYHALAVPSQCLETGPMVVLEAFAAGVPVLGSNLGGIAELVTDSRDGLLVEPGSAAHWAAALERIVADTRVLSRLSAGVRPPRHMGNVAQDMLPVYGAVASGEQLGQPQQGPASALEQPVRDEQATQTYGYVE